MTILRPTQGNDMLPVLNATKPYWRTDLHWLDEHRSTKELPESCDILIIGAGMTGVSTAFHLQNEEWTEQPSIVLLEARQVCSGATGRNGGHVKIMPPTLMKLIREQGVLATTELVNFVHKTIYALKHVIEQEKLDVEHELRRSFNVFLDSKEAEDVNCNFQKLVGENFGGIKEVDSVNHQYVENITSVKGAKAGLSTAAISLWPYKFVTQLLERVVQRGANLQTNTPVTEVCACTDGSSLVMTSRGKIKARKVVFATNGYTAGLLSQYREVIVPIKGVCSHIALPKDGAAPRLANTYNIHHEPDQVEYLNPRPDGSIVVGGGQHLYRQNKNLWYNTVDDSTVIKPAEHYFDGYMQKIFRGWEDSGAYTDTVWSGIMGRTRDELPHMGKVPGSENQYLCCGFNGGGMPLIYLSALGIARMVHGSRSFEETGIPQAFETSAARSRVA